ncbi:macro domain-containing protein [uncultured Jatrophihabitans sp.]|uniref:macro domain-containing protein n=1 Tax=uncultured Jatrophihabitans sp. TaxID=1610747 RepID=UPI0035CB6C6E
MRIELVSGDITRVDAQVLVTAANKSLKGGGGVDGAIHRAAGRQLLAALRPLAPCPAGDAVITDAFELPAPVRYVVHAVGPRYGSDKPSDALLRSAYLAAIRCCDEVGARSVAFPSLSTGAYRYPLDEACDISVDALRHASTRVETCLLVAYDRRTHDSWQRALDATNRT